MFDDILSQDYGFDVDSIANVLIKQSETIDRKTMVPDHDVLKGLLKDYIRCNTVLESIYIINAPTVTAFNDPVLVDEPLNYIPNEYKRTLDCTDMSCSKSMVPFSIYSKTIAINCWFDTNPYWYVAYVDYDDVVYIHKDFVTLYSCK